MPAPTPESNIDARALNYHENPRPGKLAVTPTKPLATQRDLSMAYSPGVAAPCKAIEADPLLAARYTARGNLVAVVSNGTAVLGLGNIGPLASKPVMEGKAVLFKKFADIDVFDIEVDALDPKKLIEVVAALEPTFGAINLEDIKAPECFEVERELKARMGIPVFHDDQHGTAIVVAAALTNALELNGKAIGDLKVVSTGGGAAGIACLELMVAMGLKRERVWLYDIGGLVHEGRTDLSAEKARFSQPGPAIDLPEALKGADMFLGLSAPGVLKPEMVKDMAAGPMIFALANPTPEIMPDLAREARPDAMVATGRSDFPNQINNVLCFPFIFRGALDVGAREINEEMKMAAVRAIAELARASAAAETAKAYEGEDLRFGPENLIPKPFDPRLLEAVAPAVAQAAMDSGVAVRPIADMGVYRESLARFVYRSGFLMKPVFARARGMEKRVVYADGEHERVLQAAQAAIEEKVARPIIIGRRKVVEARCEKFALKIRPDVHFEICDPEDDPRYGEYWRGYHALTERQGVTPDSARQIIRTNTTAIAAMMLHRGEADAAICGLAGHYLWHLKYLESVIGRSASACRLASLTAVITPKATVFIADAYAASEPSGEELAQITLMAAQEMRRFGVEPKAAFVCGSNFGARDTPGAVKLRQAVRILDRNRPDFEYEGEMHVDAAMDPAVRHRIFPNSRLTGPANLLIFPNLDAAHAAVNLLVSMADGLRVGPLLMGLAKPAHIVTPTTTARGLLNMTAFAAVDAAYFAAEQQKREEAAAGG